MLEFQRFFKCQRRIYRHQGACGSAARQPLQVKAKLPQALADGDIGQSSEATEIAHTPAVQRLENVGSFFCEVRLIVAIEKRSQGFARAGNGEEDFERQKAKTFRLLTFRNDGNAGKSTGSVLRGIGIGGNGDVYFESTSAWIRAASSAGESGTVTGDGGAVGWECIGASGWWAGLLPAWRRNPAGSRSWRVS